MDPHFHSTPGSPSGNPFPALPIISADQIPRSTAEKYGGLYYFGIAGLIVILALVSWFGYGLWSHREVWSNIYVLHDAGASDDNRIRAAFALSRDPRVNQRQYWDMCLRRPLPGLARYLLAESLTADAATDDPRAFALTVAHSPDWPDWLRLALVRPLAYAASDGVAFPTEALETLAKNADPNVALWAEFAMSADRTAGENAKKRLAQACAQQTASRELACLLSKAAQLPAGDRDRKAILDKATLWNRVHHEPTAALWKGWAVSQGQLVRTPAS